MGLGLWRSGAVVISYERATERISLVRRDALAGSLIKQHVENLLSLALTPISAEAILPNALGLALDLNISVYDACYVACSRYCKVPPRYGKHAPDPQRPFPESEAHFS